MWFRTRVPSILAQKVFPTASPRHGGAGRPSTRVSPKLELAMKNATRESWMSSSALNPGPDVRSPWRVVKDVSRTGPQRPGLLLPAAGAPVLSSRLLVIRVGAGGGTGCATVCGSLVAPPTPLAPPPPPTLLTLALAVRIWPLLCGACGIWLTATAEWLLGIGVCCCCGT